MSKNYEVLYTSGVNPSMVESALSNTLATFQAIEETDSKLEKQIVNRKMAIIVALKPNYFGSGEDEILTIAQIGEIDTQEHYNLFALKATSRAVEQRSRGHDVDTAPMEMLTWLPDAKLYQGSSASVNGLHVGIAGSWAHHGRLLAVSFADSLAESLGLPPSRPDDTQRLYSEEESATRLVWLNEGQDSGDNMPEDDTAREQYRYIFDMIAPFA